MTHTNVANLLAVDTSTELCSVALMYNGALYSRAEIAPRDHTKKILPMVDEVLKEAGIRLQDLDALVFGKGPGSFTGVRIGIGIAQGLAFGADLPMIGISTLEALAQGAYRLNQSTHVACAIDARMSEVYWGQYQRQNDGSWQAIALQSGQTECVIAPNLLVEQVANDPNQWMCVGTGWDAYAETLNLLPLLKSTKDHQPHLYPDAQDMVVLAQIQWQQGNTVAVEDSQPTYLRDKVTWKKLPGRE